MSPQRILAVDDDGQIRLLLHRVLTRAGYALEATATGEEALEMLGAGPFDLLMVNKSLAGMSGFEVIARARERHPTLAVVLITAHPEPFTAAQERLDGYLAKPFRGPEVIEETVRNALECRADSLAPVDLKGRLEKVVADFAPVTRKSR